MNGTKFAKNTARLVEKTDPRERRWVKADSVTARAFSRNRSRRRTTISAGAADQMFVAAVLSADPTMSGMRSIFG